MRHEPESSGKVRKRTAGPIDKAGGPVGVAGHLAAIVAFSDDAIVSQTLEGAITSWNLGAERLFGYSADRAVGQSMMMLVPDDLRDEELRILRKLRQGRRIEQYETSRIRGDGERIHVAINVLPIKDAAGRTVAAASISHDISRQKILEERLRQSQKMEIVGKLAGGLTHDFNNLLQVIVSYSDALAAEVREHPRWLDLANEIRHAAQCAGALTRRLVGLSRPQVPRAVPLNLNIVVMQMQPILKRLIGARSELVTELDSRLALVYADVSQIEQVLMNLAANARDAMPRGGRLSIETRNIDADKASGAGLPAGQVMLSVADSGCGMPPEVAARAFEPFFTTKHPDRGTGLGLTIVQEVVRQNGGRIDVQSEPGRGTTLRVLLPRLVQAADLHGPQGPDGARTASAELALPGDRQG